MRTTEILMDEHRVIEQVLACLEKMADAAAATGRVETPSARDAIGFLRTFADRCHHMKEEERLFPAMERAGLPPHAGPTEVMRQEHEIGRGHVRRMERAVDEFDAGSRDAVRTFEFEARSFVRLLREHIAKEDQVLFPMADRMLSARAQEELLQGFERAEREEMGEGVHERFVELANRLAERWGVSAAEVRAKAHTCSCSHA
jgi:hemerythrin-like domain-containing protein